MRLRLSALTSTLAITIAACGGSGTPAPPTATATVVAAPTSTALATTRSGFPGRAIAFVVPYAAGGGSDILIRSLDKIGQDLKVFPQSFTISNVAGGSGFTGKQQAISKPADGYTLTIVDDPNIFGQILNQAPMKYTDFTYIARLVSDYNMVVVRTESPYKTLTDWIDGAKAKAKGVSVGGTGIGNNDHVHIANIEKRTGTQFNYISFDSGGQVMTNLLGGKIDSAMANPSEAFEQMRAGKVRALGITSPQRLADLKDVPTLKEQGIDYVVAQFRGVGGPKGIPADVVAYLEEGLRRIAKSEQWKTDYLEKYQQADGFMGSAEFTKFMDDFFKENEQAFKELPSLKSQ
jgi:putative tricarboxylic transport membrane protein